MGSKVVRLRSSRAGQACIGPADGVWRAIAAPEAGPIWRRMENAGASEFSWRGPAESALWLALVARAVAGGRPQIYPRRDSGGCDAVFGSKS